MLESHCSELRYTAKLICEEIDEAISLLKYGSLDQDESKLVAKSFAAGISQLALMRNPLICEAIAMDYPQPV